VRALVTGASRGIGRSTALRLARDGFEVAVHYRSHDDDAERLVEEIEKAGGSAIAVGADLGTREGIHRLARTLRTRWRALDALVLNAGSYPRQPFRDIDPDDFEACFRVHVFGPAELVRQLLPLLEAAPTGGIVFVSSVLAFEGSRHGAHYAAAKAASLGLARSLARELAPRVRVNVVAPGAIETAILSGDSPAQRSDRASRIPLGRIGRPEEVAEAISFLVSERASYLTGTTLHVNGGVRME
jgi:3-oxoacyl-[acyl-carrier protein] reductase